MEIKHTKASQNTSSFESKPGLEIVLKCDSVGSLEAAVKALSEMTDSGVISIIQSSVGAIGKSDVFIAETGSRLIVGFQVDVLPGIDRVLKKQGIEVRLYEVINSLTSDLRTIVENMISSVPEEEVTGTAKVIALFKSSRRGIIIGCQILGGFFSVGRHFRIISAMGQIYNGRVESIHLGDNIIQKATQGQKIGIKIKDFKKTKIGDLVECFRILPKKEKPWHPSGEIIRK